MLDDNQKWQAVVAKDSTQGDRFFYGVTTTGIYCRPGCASRTPLRENVRFYETTAAAEADGLRACLRCRPSAVSEQTGRDLSAQVRHYIRRHIDEPGLITLGALGRHFKLSPFYLQRTFKAAAGITPKKYAEEIRMQSFKEGLRHGTSVTDAIYDAGFGSGSRVYERVDTQLGMTPTQYREHGKGIEISYVAMQTPLGLVMVGATDRGLCFVEFGESELELLQSLRSEYAAASLAPMADPPSQHYAAWLQGLSSYLAGEKALGKLPAALHGTAFQSKVWNYLQTIPDGSVQSYAEVAKGIGQPGATRAVASACAANCIALAVPCHRVIRGDGSLGGYRWGLSRKRALLDAERRLQALASQAEHTAPLPHTGP